MPSCPTYYRDEARNCRYYPADAVFKRGFKMEMDGMGAGRSGDDHKSESVMLNR
jgi:hypothetical protein